MYWAMEWKESSDTSTGQDLKIALSRLICRKIARQKTSRKA